MYVPHQRFVERQILPLIKQTILVNKRCSACYGWIVAIILNKVKQQVIATNKVIWIHGPNSFFKRGRAENDHYVMIVDRKIH